MVGIFVSVKEPAFLYIGNVDHFTVEVKVQRARSNNLVTVVVNLIVRIDSFEIRERELHRRDAVGRVSDVIDGKIVGDGRAAPRSFDVNEVPLDVEHVVLHDREKTDRLTIVVEIVAGNDVRIAPNAANGTGAFPEPFVERRQKRNVRADSIVDVKHRFARLFVDAGFSTGKTLAVRAGPVLVLVMTVGHPSLATVARSWIGIVVVVLAAIVLYGMVDDAFGVPPITLTEIP